MIDLRALKAQDLKKELLPSDKGIEGYLFKWTI